MLVDALWKVTYPLAVVDRHFEVYLLRCRKCCDGSKKSHCCGREVNLARMFYGVIAAARPSQLIQSQANLPHVFNAHTQIFMPWTSFCIKSLD